MIRNGYILLLLLVSESAFADMARPVAGGMTRGPAVLPQVEHRAGITTKDMRPVVKTIMAEPEWRPSTCGLRTPPIPNGVGGVDGNHAGYYFYDGLCRFGTRKGGVNPFPFTSSGDCAAAASSGYCVSRNPASVGLLPTISGYVQGVVEKWKGNFIPSRTSGEEGKVMPLVTRVFILQGKVKPTIGKTGIAIPGPNERKVAAVVPTDLNGNFSVSLPPNDYTITIERDGILYRNDLDHDGNILSNHLDRSEIEIMKIQDTSDAVY